MASPVFTVGCDFHLSAVNIQHALDDPARYTVKRRSLPDGGVAGTLPPGCHGRSFSTIHSKERNLRDYPSKTDPVLQKSLDILPQSVRNGCLAQLTAMSLTGDFGAIARTTSWHYLRQVMPTSSPATRMTLNTVTPRLDVARGWWIRRSALISRHFFSSIVPAL